jgi:hypothetical protein
LDTIIISQGLNFAIQYTVSREWHPEQATPSSLYQPSRIIFGIGWSETIGQSAYYSLQTKKKAGIVLILETMKDRKYWIRLNTTIEHFNLPIDTWPIGNSAY